MNGRKRLLMVSIAAALACLAGIPDSQAQTRGGRRLERLDRAAGEASVHELERVVSKDGFALLNSPIGCHGNGNELGLRTAEYNSRGWIQNDYPISFEAAPRAYAFGELALSSRSCDKLYDELGEKQDYPGWSEARDRCRVRGYKPLRVYVEMHNEQDAASLVSEIEQDDPWNTYHEINVRYVKAYDLLELRRKIAALVMDCHVIEYLFVGSHGSPNSVNFSQSGTRVSVTDLLRTGISLCALAPDAKLQFTGCSLACGRGARTVLDELKSLVKNAGDDVAVPRSKVSLLLNTAAGLQTRFRYWKSVRSTNGLALEYLIEGGTVTSDFDTEATPACGD